MKLLSLFDGSGGFPLAGAMCGITPVAASKIEPFPIRVTTKRFPQMKHLGDISKVNGAEIEPVDVITFGSPCQDLSVAGKRKGLNHSELGDEETTRSGLFMEAIRIIREMKEATNGEYPTFAVWENVPGAYSSNKGEDFRTVLEELEKTACDSADPVPRPPKGKWLLAGEILGDNYSIAWRTLDAQYWGVPQRRRRIYLVADFRGQRAGKILFEREGLRGNFTQSRTQGQGTAGNAENGIGTAGREKETGNDLGLDVVGLDLYNQALTGRKAKTLSSAASDADHVPCVAYAVENHPADSRVNIIEDGTCQCLTSRMGTGGGNVPLVLEPQTLKIRCGCEGGGKGALIQHNKSATLSCNNDQVLFAPVNVVCSLDEKMGQTYIWENQANTLAARDFKQPQVVAYQKVTGALCANSHPGSYTGQDAQNDMLVAGIENEKYIVRRLTPLECCRLQGFPDCWCNGLETPEPTEEDLEFWREVFETHRTVISGASKPKSDKQIIKWLKDPCTDSAIYKMWGNGIALPNALFVMQGIAEELKRERFNENRM